jgi:hypothetical protein
MPYQRLIVIAWRDLPRIPVHEDVFVWYGAHDSSETTRYLGKTSRSNGKDATPH